MSKVFLTQIKEHDGEFYVELSPEFINLLEWDIDDVIGFELIDSRIQVYNLTKREANQRPIDTAIKDCIEEYEDEIDLYKTYGGD